MFELLGSEIVKILFCDSLPTIDYTESCHIAITPLSQPAATMPS
jgi:hypothetical protein